LIAQVEAEIREKLGRYIFGVDKDPLEGAFVSALARSGVTAIIAELGTQGALSQRVGRVPGNETHLIVTAQEQVALMRADVVAERQNTPPSADARTIGELMRGDAQQVAVKLLNAHGQGRNALAIVVIAEEDGMAIGVTDGVEARGRSYGYTLAHGGAEWAAGWGLSIGWWLATEHEHRSTQA
jgi:hypothetical protein